MPSSLNSDALLMEQESTMAFADVESADHRSIPHMSIYQHQSKKVTLSEVDQEDIPQRSNHGDAIALLRNNIGYSQSVKDHV